MMPDTRLKFCPTCQKEKQKSKVYSTLTSTTLVYVPPFWDEDGRYHKHDTPTTYAYYCSNDHNWMESGPINPCWCGWPNEPRTEGNT